MKTYTQFMHESKQYLTEESAYEKVAEQLEEILDDGGGVLKGRGWAVNVSEEEADAALFHLDYQEYDKAEKICEDVLKAKKNWLEFISDAMDAFLGEDVEVIEILPDDYEEELTEDDEEDVEEKTKVVVRGGKKMRIKVPTKKKRLSAKQKAAFKKAGRKRKGKKVKASTLRKRAKSMAKR